MELGIWLRELHMAGAGGSLRAGSACSCGLVVRVALDGKQRGEEKQALMVLRDSIAFSE